MDFRIEQRFPGALDAVETALLDPAFLDRLGELPKLGTPQLIRHVDAGATIERAIRYQFTGEVNAAVRRVVDPSRLTWVEQSVLDRATHVTTWKIVPDHYGSMIRCSGTFRLQPDGSSATRRITDADIKVGVPLVGGKVERAIVSGLREHAAGEEQVMADWLRTGP